MKILYIANIRLPTEKAHGIQIMKMCEAFAHAGANVELAVTSRSTSIKDELFDYYGVERNFSVVRIPVIDTVRFGRVGFLIETFIFSIGALVYTVAHPADIIFSRDELVLWLLSFFKRNIVWESHDGKLNSVARKTLKATQKIVVTTAYMRDAYLAFGIPPEKVLLARNGVDLDSFSCAPQTITKIREKLVSGDERIVMYVGRLDGWKGVETLLAASKLFPSNVRLVVVGGEPKQVARFKAEYPGVVFVGFIPYREIGCYQKSADVLVLPNTAKNKISVNNTSPLKLFTYMAAEKPIVVSDLPSIREVLSEKACYFFVPDDPSSLAREVENALNGGATAKVKARVAYELVHSFSWDARAQMILRVFKNLPQ